MKVPLRARDAAAGLLVPYALQGSATNAQAEDPRLHAQHQEKGHDPRSQSQVPTRCAATSRAPSLPTNSWMTLPACAPAREGCTWPPQSTSTRHGGRLIALRPDNRRHRGNGARVGQVVQQRPGKRHIHSDRGTQYTSGALIEWAQANNVRLSWSSHRQRRGGVVLRNADRTTFATRTDIKRTVIEFIEAD